MTANVIRLRAVVALLAVTAGAARVEAEAQGYVVDPGRSRVRIHLDRAGLVKFMGHAHEIEAPVADGRVEVVDNDPARSSVSLRFGAARLAVVPGSEAAGDIPTVEERMRGPEVLDVARYPEITFVSKSVRSVEAQGDRFRIVVTGSLTLHGRAVPVDIPLDVTRASDGSMDARGETALKHKDLGIEPPAVAGVVKVADRFRLQLEVHATAAAASGSTAQKPGPSTRTGGSVRH